MCIIQSYRYLYACTGDITELELVCGVGGRVLILFRGSIILLYSHDTYIQIYVHSTTCAHSVFHLLPNGFGRAGSDDNHDLFLVSYTRKYYIHALTHGAL